MEPMCGAVMHIVHRTLHLTVSFSRCDHWQPVDAECLVMLIVRAQTHLEQRHCDRFPNSGRICSLPERPPKKLETNSHGQVV